MFDRLSFDADTAAILLMKTGNRAQKGRLAATARSEKREKRAGRNGDIDVGECNDIPVTFLDAGLTKQTLYEIGRENITRSTYDRALESLQAVNGEIEALIKAAWGRA